MNTAMYYICLTAAMAAAIAAPETNAWVCAVIGALAQLPYILARP